MHDDYKIFLFCFAFEYQILLFDFTYVINILNFVSVFWLTELHLWTLKFSHVCNTDNLAIFCLFFFGLGSERIWFEPKDFLFFSSLEIGHYIREVMWLNVKVNDDDDKKKLSFDNDDSSNNG